MIRADGRVKRTSICGSGEDGSLGTGRLAERRGTGVVGVDDAIVALAKELIPLLPDYHDRVMHWRMRRLRRLVSIRDGGAAVSAYGGARFSQLRSPGMTSNCPTAMYTREKSSSEYDWVFTSEGLLRQELNATRSQVVPRA